MDDCSLKEALPIELLLRLFTADVKWISYIQCIPKVTMHFIFPFSYHSHRGEYIRIWQHRLCSFGKCIIPLFALMKTNRTPGAHVCAERWKVQMEGDTESQHKQVTIHQILRKVITTSGCSYTSRVRLWCSCGMYESLLYHKQKNSQLWKIMISVTSPTFVTMAG